MQEIVAHTFLSVCEKNHQFLRSIKKMHTKKWFLFSASQCSLLLTTVLVGQVMQSVVSVRLFLLYLVKQTTL